MSNTFPKTSRLLTSADYRRLQTKSRSLKTPYFIISYRDNEVARPRLGVIVTKRAAKHAVTRNTIKRIAKESFRVIRHQLPAADFILIARHTIKTLGRTELRQLLDKKWQQSAHGG
jgi:ribonuclease P protein component